MAENRSTRLVWRDDLMMTGYSANGHTVALDAAPYAGGHEAGFRPMDLMLTSLAGCTGMDVISILRKKRQEFTALEITVEGKRQDEHPKVYTEIWVHFTITGANVDPVAVERAIELSRDKYCAAAATLRHTATLHYDYEIITAEPEAPLAEEAH